MIQVVRGDTSDQVERLGVLAQLGCELSHDLAQSPMLRVQNADVTFPICVASLRPWTLKEIATGKHKRTAILSRDSTAGYVLPICRVKRQFPDVGATLSRTPRRLRHCDASNRPGKVRSVPGFLIESLVQQIEQL
jgi:hypothetical protein